MSTPSEAVPFSRMPETPVDLISQGMAIIKVENDSMLQVAVQRPRNESEVLKGALGELALAPEEAKTAFYTIPYKEKQPDGSKRIVNVQGPSIGAAMALARRWGNCSTAARIVNEDKEGFDIDGVFIDLESNFRVSKPFRVGKYGKRRDGGIYRLDPQRELMALQAGASKALRNSIINGLPKYLVSAYYNRAREIAGGKQDQKADAKRVEALLAAFARHKVTKEMLEAYCERPVSEWMGEEVANLRGVWNALQDKQATVEELFGSETDATPAASNPPGVVTPESLAGATVTGQDDAPPPARPAAVADECRHPNVPPSKVDALPLGKSIVCPDCGEELKRERQPGEDTDEGPTPAAPPAEDPRAAVESVAAAAGRAKPRQSKLQE